MNDLAMTNVWLAILAIVSSLEFLMIVVAGVAAYRAYRQVMALLDTVERRHIAPLRARADGILDEIEILTGKVKHAQQSVGHAFGVAARVFPVVGILRGIQVAAATFMKRDPETWRSETAH